MLTNKRSKAKELVYGINAVQSILDVSPEKILNAWVVKGREEDKRILNLIYLLNQYGVKVQYAMRHFMDEKTEGGVHQGIIVEIMATPPKNERDLEELVEKLDNPLFLILDGVTDPRNLGAAMRSALGAYVDAVIVPKDKSAPFSAAARKAASGAADVLPLIAVTNLARTITYLQEHDIKVIGMAGEAQESIYSCDLKGALAIVMGAEDTGMRRLTREKCDCLVKIPMNEKLESLNVSVAAGIALFEAMRQRTQS